MSKYPLVMCQANMYETDACTEATAQMRIGGKKFWLLQTVRYCSKKAFEKIKRDYETVAKNEEFSNVPGFQRTPQIRIIGDTFLESVNYKKDGTIKNEEKIKNMLTIPDEDDCECKYIVKDEIMRGRTIGYIPVGQNKFIRVKKKTRLPTILLIILLIMLLAVIGLLLVISMQHPIMLINEPLATIG